MRYFFIFGNHPTLSLAELNHVIKESNSLISFSSGVILNDVKVFDLDILINQLGGVVKAGIILAEVSQDRLADNMLQELIKIERKVFFGISDYFSELNTRELGLDVKKTLKENGKSARFVSARSKVLSSVIVKTNKLLNDNGREFVLLPGARGKIYLGITKVVQDFESFSERDYGRPERSMRDIGLMPPKLARMMINLAGLKPGETLLDPFCGAGTILQEALLLGIEVEGSDVSEESIQATKKNLAWLEKSYKLQATSYKLMRCDATKLSEKVKIKVDAIVTEPYLGPIRGKFDLEKVIKELSRLYLDSLREFKKVLKPGGRIVMIWPVFKHGKKIEYLPILEPVEKLGFKNIIPSNKRGGPGQRAVLKALTPRGSFLYSRPDQKVLREIWVFDLPHQTPAMEGSKAV
jgi:tRNA G10  N-methylase Trm11